MEVQDQSITFTLVRVLSALTSRLQFLPQLTQGESLEILVEIDVQRPDGTRLHIHYHEPQPPLAAVIQTFLESR